jgi:hypothetical protein
MPNIRDNASLWNPVATTRKPPYPFLRDEHRPLGYDYVISALFIVITVGLWSTVKYTKKRKVANG